MLSSGMLSPVVAVPSLSCAKIHNQPSEHECASRSTTTWFTTPASKIQQQEQGSTSRRRSTNAATTHSCRPLQLCNPRQKFVVVVIVTCNCGLPSGKSACRWGQDEHRHHHWLQGKVLPQQPRVQHRHRVDSRTMTLTVAVPGVGTGTSSAAGVGMSAAAGQLGSLCSLSPVVPALA